MCPKRTSQLRKINLFYHSKYALIRFYSDKLKSHKFGLHANRRMGGIKPSNFIFAQAVCENGSRLEELDQIYQKRKQQSDFIHTDLISGN